jgi:hypothetical protein
LIFGDEFGLWFGEITAVIASPFLLLLPVVVLRVTA